MKDSIVFRKISRAKRDLKQKLLAGKELYNFLLSDPDKTNISSNLQRYQG